MRKMIAFILAVFVGGTFLYGCGYKEGVRQPDTRSYIWFSGNTKGTVAIIDGQSPFQIDASSGGKTDKHDGKTLYELAPGKHEVVVKRDGEAVVNRLIMISAGATREIRVP